MAKKKDILLLTDGSGGVVGTDLDQIGRAHV